MPIIFNNTEIENVMFNGTEIEEVNVNGTKVFEKVKPLEYTERVSVGTAQEYKKGKYTTYIFNLKYAPIDNNIVFTSSHICTWEWVNWKYLGYLYRENSLTVEKIENRLLYVKIFNDDGEGMGVSNNKPNSYVTVTYKYIPT